MNTHTRAAQADNSQRLQDAGSADNPGKSQKQDDPQNILEAGEVDTHEGPHLRALRGKGEVREKQNVVYTWYESIQLRPFVQK